MEQDSAWRLPSRLWMLTADGSGSKAKLEKARLFTWCCRRIRPRDLRAARLGFDTTNSAHLLAYVSMQKVLRAVCSSLACGPLQTAALPACDRRNDADFVARSDWGLGFFQKAYIFVIQEDVNKPANMIMVVADALFQTGIGPIETSDHFADRCTIGFNDLLVLG